MSLWGFWGSPVSTSYLNTRTLGFQTQDTMPSLIWVLGNLELKMFMLQGVYFSHWAISPAQSGVLIL